MVAREEYFKTVLDPQLGIRAPHLISSRQRTKRAMLAAMIGLSEKARRELPVSTLGHFYEIDIASFVAVSQGYWRSDTKDAMKKQVIGDLFLDLRYLLINTVYLESENFQEELRQDEKTAFNNAEQEIAHCVRTRIAEYMLDINHDIATAKLTGFGLAESLYRNLTDACPIENCHSVQLKLMLQTSLAAPMIRVFENATRCRF